MLKAQRPALCSAVLIQLKCATQPDNIVVMQPGTNKKLS